MNDDDQDVKMTNNKKRNRSQKYNYQIMMDSCLELKDNSKGSIPYILERTYDHESLIHFIIKMGHRVLKLERIERSEYGIE